MPYKDPEEARARSRAYYVARREERRTYGAAYRAAHRSEACARTQAWRIANAGKSQTIIATWHAAHPEKVRTYKATYRATHREKIREHDHRREARLRSQFVAPVDASAIYVRDRGRCHICGKKVKQADASMDHLKPISLGGVHAPWNVSLAHLRCNLRRNNRGTAQLLLEMLEI